MPSGVDPVMPRQRVVVTSRSFGSGHEDPGLLLRQHGLEVKRCDPRHDSGELRRALGDAVAWIAGTGPIHRTHLDAAARLRVIARLGAGVDSVDLAAARDRGIVVTVTPGANAEAVADHALALMLSALRRVVECDSAVRRGEWPAPVTRQLAGLTIGLIGFGHVARALARRLVGGFEARVLGFDPRVDGSTMTGFGVIPATLAELLTQADIISLHLSGGGPTFVDDALLARCPRAPILVNTARGDLVDEEAVTRALSLGSLAGYAADVFRHEPPHSSPLLTAPNVTLTPHAAALTVEAIDRMGMGAAREVVRVLEGSSPLNPVASEHRRTSA